MASNLRPRIRANWKKGIIINLKRCSRFFKSGLPGSNVMNRRGAEIFLQVGDGSSVTPLLWRRTRRIGHYLVEATTQVPCFRVHEVDGTIANHVRAERRPGHKVR